MEFYRFLCEREMLNPSDRYAVAVLKDNIIIGHLPWVLSRLYSSFIARGGTITFIVNGARRYWANLAQGGLEVPCKLNFLSTSKEIEKLKLVLTCNSIEHVANSCYNLVCFISDYT